MILLHQFPPAFGLPNASPFCLKLETWLRMAAVPYRNVYLSDPRQAPKGKLPFIELEGRKIADSQLCIDYLTASRGVDLDAGLSPVERAHAHALRSLLEDHLYWILLYCRWLDERHWPQTRDAFFSALPLPMRVLVPQLVRTQIRRDLHGHGIGRHEQDEIYAFGVRDITALADWLGEQPFFMGAQPTAIDATAYAFLANILVPTLDNELRRAAQRHPNLSAYVERMTARYYGE